MKYKVRINILSQTLSAVLNSTSLNYPDISKINDQGLYIVFSNKRILYVGKTNRSGKVRMSELASDFRSHTLNKKLLSEYLKSLGFVFDVLTNAIKKEWIDKQLITHEEFKKHQSIINSQIKTSLRFKFQKQNNPRKLILLEHFTISVLNPKYND